LFFSKFFLNLKMVLEATVICMDNSDWMRNGDYPPSRLEAQNDAVNLLCSTKTQSNPESTVAVVACGGKSPEVLVTLTNDIGKVLSAVHSAKLGGPLNFMNGIQVAQLVLKHRQNKNQQQRIVFFVGSPISEDKNDLVQLGKRLKKNNVAVDIINFGEENDNKEKLEAFYDSVQNNENSHLLSIAPGIQILSEVLFSSPIFAGTEGFLSDRTAFGIGQPASDLAMEDPELALALNMSLEEERARLEAQRKAGESSDAMETVISSSLVSSSTSSTSSTGAVSSESLPTVPEETFADEEERELLRQALAMSEMHSHAHLESLDNASSSSATIANTTATNTTVIEPVPNTSSSGNTSSTSSMSVTDSSVSSVPDVSNSSVSTTPTLKVSSPDIEMQDVEEEEDMLETAKALSMSLMDISKSQKNEAQNPSEAPKESEISSSATAAATTATTASNIMDDPAFVTSVLMTLPGVDPNNESIRRVLDSLRSQEKENAQKDTKKDK